MKQILFFLFFITLIIPFSIAQVLPGDVWISPSDVTGDVYDVISVNVRVNSGDHILAAYGLEISYDPERIMLDTSTGDNGVVTGADGFGPIVNANDPGKVIIGGFYPTGSGPGNDLEILKISFITDRHICGVADLDVTVIDLIDVEGNDIETPRGIGGRITTLGCYLIGDVNGDKVIDIIDALLVAQYYVGLVGNINKVAAEVNCDSSLDIIDALLIAQYYVGLVSEFC